MTSAASDPLVPSRLAEGGAAPVLVSDFQPFSSAPRLSTVVASQARDRPVYQIDPLPALSGATAYLPLPEMAAAYASAIPATEHDTVLVVAYCGTANLCLRIAEHLTGSLAAKVAVALVNPVWPDADLVRSQFADFRKELGAAGGPSPSLDGAPARVMAEMENVLREDLAALALRKGLSTSIPALRDLLTGYRAWLAFLLANHNDPPNPADALRAGVGIEVLQDTASPAVLPGAEPGSFPVTRTELLDRRPPVTPELADLVLTRCADRPDPTSPR